MLAVIDRLDHASGRIESEPASRAAVLRAVVLRAVALPAVALRAAVLGAVALRAAALRNRHGPPGAGAGHPGGRRPSLLGAAFVSAGLAMIPWVLYLAATLPATAPVAHWSLAWAGLDGGEALSLFATGRLLMRRDNRCVLTAVGAAMLLLADAWFDVTSAAPGPDLATAIVMAVFAEIPAALLCTALATRVLRTPFPRA